MTSLSHPPVDLTDVGDMAVVTFTDRRLLDDMALRVIDEALNRRRDPPRPCRILLNLGNVEYLSSKTLSALITYHHRLQAGGHQLLLCNLTPRNEEIFQTTGLDRVLHLYHPLPAGAEVPPAEPPRTPRACTGSPRAAAAPSSGPLLGIWDPEPAHREQLLASLSPGWTVAALTELEDVAPFCQHEEPAAVVLQLPWLASSAGLGPEALATVLCRIRALSPQVAVVTFADTSSLSPEQYGQVLAAGARHIVNAASPTFAEDLAALLRSLTRARQSEREERQELLRQFADRGLVGTSPLLQEVFRAALKASLFSDAPVLLLGETGTGKELLAHAIHHLDPQRGDKPFIPLHCGTVSKTLAESELFGHIRGAFSGAEHERLGVFRRAHGGTLLLDEIGELPPDLQPKLLRVLEERRLLPVGADYEHPVDVRIIAATNRSLEQMVQEGSFRQDLLQRLSGLQIHLPPLRERPQDIPAQVLYFLQRLEPERRRGVGDFSPKVLEALQQQPWVGNSRQLEHCVWEIVAYKEQGAVVEMEDLPAWVLQGLAEGSVPPLAAPLPPAAAGEAAPWDAIMAWACQQQWTLAQTLAEVERRLLQAALEQNQGDRSRTAAALGLSRRSLFYKLKRCRLAREGRGRKAPDPPGKMQE